MNQLFIIYFRLVGCIYYPAIQGHLETKLCPMEQLRALSSASHLHFYCTNKCHISYINTKNRRGMGEKIVPRDEAFSCLSCHHHHHSPSEKYLY